jgi:hypothetical protein
MRYDEWRRRTRWTDPGRGFMCTSGYTNRAVGLCHGPPSVKEDVMPNKHLQVIYDRGESVLSAYRRAKHAGPDALEDDLETLIADLMTDLMHLAAHKGLDLESIQRRATMHFEAEQADEVGAARGDARMTHDEIRKRHAEHLRSYHHSAEYAEHATTVGLPVPQGDLPPLTGVRWEIDKETYREFLEVLPPLAHSDDSFYRSEFTFSDVTTKYTKDGDRYYCEFARYPQKRARGHPTETPWGPAQTSTEIAPGIVAYTTASHGGYYVSPERVSTMPKSLRDFKPFAGPNWYEEDCDWAVVALAFPKFFPPDAIPAALKTLERSQPGLFAEAAAMQASGGRGE